MKRQTGEGRGKRQKFRYFGEAVAEWFTKEELQVCCNCILLLLSSLSSSVRLYKKRSLLCHSLYCFTADWLSIKLQEDHQNSIITAHLASYGILMAVCEKESVTERTRRMSVKQIKTQDEARKGDVGCTAEVLWL